MPMLSNQYRTTLRVFWSIGARVTTGGVARVADTAYCEEDRIFDDPPDRVRIITRRPFDAGDVADEPAWFEYLRGAVCGGHLAGSRATIERLSDAFTSATRSSLGRGLTPSEEQILPTIMVRQPHLFEPAYGDYDAIFANQRRIRRSAVNLLFSSGRDARPATSSSWI
jgi:hypothetical protein